jgi:3-methyladenine DNA glycosylase AlkD
MLGRMTPLAGTLLGRLRTVYETARDPERAAPMAAYMRHQFAYLGLPAPAQRALTREVLAGTPRPAEADLRDIALACWALDEREYQYFAVGLLRRYIKVCGPGFLATTRQLVVTKPWWDTVDELAAHAVGPLVLGYPQLKPEMDAWAREPDKWLVRTAILHQTQYREATDSERLFGYCLARAGHPDFFIRKAIGWALREYAKTDPEAVRAFVEAHRDKLSGLSVREALKHLR